VRRLFWVAVGAASTVATLRKAREVADRHVPPAARSALGAAAGASTLVQRAVDAFRVGTAEREAELRAELLAGADLPSSRARVDAWRAARADRRDADRTTAAVDGDHPGAGPVADRKAAARPGSAAASAAARRGPGSHRAGSHRAEDPEDGSLGYSFF